MNNYCQTVIFSDKAYNAIIDETFRKDPIETGGILLGYALDNGIWVVMEVVPPGIDSVHEYAYFEYDEKFVNYLAESIATKYENKLELLGLWHRHPGNMDTFSGTDDSTNMAFANLRECGAISGLVNVDPNFRLTMRHVSSPLSYDIVDVEVGDDLIPEDYFKLRHYPTKGLNPRLSTEKKNDWTDIVRPSERKSDTNNYSTTTPTNSCKRLSIRGVVLGMLAAFFFILFALLAGGQMIAGNDSAKQQMLFEFVFNSSDTNGICIQEIERIDESAGAYTLKEQHIDKVYIKPAIAVTIVSGCLFEISLLFLLVLLTPSCGRKYWRYIAVCWIIAVLAVMLLPVEFSFAFVILVVACALLLSILAKIVFGIIKVVTTRKNVPWYNKNKKLLATEDGLIRNIEPTATLGFDEQMLTYTVITDRHITRQENTLAYQLVYSANYPKDRTIRIYFIMPELDDMFNADNGLASKYIKCDKDGDKYIEFTTNNRQLNGAETILFLYDWIDTYNHHRAGDISEPQKLKTL